MIDPLELAQHIAAGQLLATVDGTDYRAVHVVGFLDEACAPHIYCTTAQWRQSPAGKLAERDQRVAELEEATRKQQEYITAQRQRIAELEQLLAAAPAPTPAPAAAAQPRARDGRTLPYGRVQCPHCDKTPWQIQLVKHIQNCHRVMLREASPENTAELSDAQIKQRLGVPADWRCASEACATPDAAQSIKNPAYCVNCAKQQPIGAVNGQAVAL